MKPSKFNGWAELEPDDIIRMGNIIVAAAWYQQALPGMSGKYVDIAIQAAYGGRWDHEPVLPAKTFSGAWVVLAPIADYKREPVKIPMNPIYSEPLPLP